MGRGQRKGQIDSRCQTGQLSKILPQNKVKNIPEFYSSVESSVIPRPQVKPLLY